MALVNMFNISDENAFLNDLYMYDDWSMNVCSNMTIGEEEEESNNDVQELFDPVEDDERSCCPTESSASENNTSTTENNTRNGSRTEVLEEFTDEQLLKIPVKELNRKMRGLENSEIVRLRKRRRSLKNRIYASVCKKKRVAEQKTYEVQNRILVKERNTLKMELEKVKTERDKIKEAYQTLEKVFIMLSGVANKTASQVHATT
ncbi:transcription factor MafB [Nematostella vectensis]|nr:transcription factor MafB [Nematostella vectensis]